MKILLLLLCAPMFCSAWTGAVHVTGRLMCGPSPYRGEKVQIWDPNFLIGYSLWSEVSTDESGYFSIKGAGDDWSGVNPFLWIPNYCGSSTYVDKQCTEGLIQVNVPEEFISGTHTPSMTFDLGTVDIFRFKQSDRFWLSSIFGASKECRYV
ncbi:hypothetical protein GCK72_021898 [Caenorhabditis remanei]|uniref:Uncharacterized protein n=1 Tax=Caenorhabditis remanei TaxID=31234 RepID=A0A6A5GM03_CAERE|nr:hypothetical protein GCK72_021898 [Caenorhabditis remanei]KAF1755329.1 hypothetical protein GCK72_021898 [Caenorhabditis remanei]